MPKKDADGGEQMEAFQDEPIPGITRSARAYEKARDERMAAGKIEVQKKTLLVAAMKEHGKVKYHRADLDVTLIPGKDKVRVSRDEEDAGEDADE